MKLQIKCIDHNVTAKEFVYKRQIICKCLLLLDCLDHVRKRNGGFRRIFKVAVDRLFQGRLGKCL